MARKSAETPTPRILVPPIGLAPVSVHTPEGQQRFPDGVHARRPLTDGERVAFDSRIQPGSFEYRRYLAKQHGVPVENMPVSPEAQRLYIAGLKPVRETEVQKAEKKITKVTVYRAPDNAEPKKLGKRRQEKLYKKQVVKDATAQIGLR